MSIATGATDADVTLVTGNGDDVINASFVGTAPGDTGSSATIESGEGDDFVFGSDGDDSIDLGVGNDKVESPGGEDFITLGDGIDEYRLFDPADSVINGRDEILDFDPNTVGQGLGGTAPLLTDDRDGDTIDLSDYDNADNPNGLSVGVFNTASDSTTFLANNDGNDQLNIALDSSSGFLYIDTNDNGTASSVLELTGVTTIDEAGFLF